jgi:large subunit ribosomal protein L5
MEKARLEELYGATIKPQLQKKLSIKNVMEVPRITKIVLNVGVKDAISDSKAIQSVYDTLMKIAGQVPVRTYAKKSIAGFKLREGMPIGVKVTLRGQRMYEFLDRLINLALPKVRDFQGVPSKFDGRGNYNLGIKEWTIFPEVDYDIGSKIHGLNVTIHTTAHNDERALALLESFGMPFRRK